MRNLVLVCTVATALAGVPCQGYNQLTALPVSGGEHVIYENQLWRANWWTNHFPSSADAAWSDMGTCDEVSEVPACTAPEWSSSEIYAVPTTVTLNGAHWGNRWWSAAGILPTSDTSGNWYKVYDCTGLSGTQTTTSSLASSATTTTTTTTPTSTTTTTTTPTTATTALCTSTAASTTATTTTTAATTAFTTTTTKATSGGSNWDGGPVGPNGECVWPNWAAKEYNNGDYVTMNNQVYEPEWWVGAATAPPNSPWKLVATCVGEPAKTTWTLDELLSQINANGPEYQQIRDPTSLLTEAVDANAAVKEQELRSASAAAAQAIEVTRVLPVDQIEAITPGNGSNPENVKRVERALSEIDFETLFPIRNKVYTYTGLLRAIGAFPAYCQTYTDGRHSDDICKRMLAVSFAHIAQEVGANWPSFQYGTGEHDPERRNPGADSIYATGTNLPLWKQALWFVREVGYTEETFVDAYRQCSIEHSNMIWGLNFQCPSNRSYFGRGSKQLSWNYNYGPFSATFFQDSNYLLESPNLVADTWLNFASAIWFAVTPQNPKPAMLHVIDGTFIPNSVDIANGMTNGFAATNDIINGGLECRGGNTSAITNRIAYYKEFMNYFKLTIDADEVLSCQGLAGFTSGGAGAVLTYLDKANTGSECHLVSWQTPWKIIVDGDYQRCLDYWFSSHWVSKSTRKVVASYGGTSIY